MKPRPEPPLLLRGGTLLTLDSEARVFPGTDLLLSGGRIAAFGPCERLPPGTRTLEVSGDLVIPGLVQGHLHLGQTFFRGLAEGRRLLDWLRQRVWPLEAAHHDESAYWCSLLGAAECLLGGTTTIQDIGIGPGAAGLVRAVEEAGFRGFVGRCLMDSGKGLPAGLASDAEKELEATERLGNRVEASSDGRLRYCLNPRFILSCSPVLWEGLVTLAERRGWPIHTHALEQREETEEVRALMGGRDEIECFDAAGVLGQDLRIAHGIWLTDAHRQRVAGGRFSVVTCPSSNLKLGSGIPDLPALRAAGIPRGVGADGSPCNNHLDGFKELRLAAQLQMLSWGPESFTGLEAMRLATSEGARALGLEEETGSLEVGKAADVVVLDGGRPELVAAPAADPHDVVAFGATPAAVRHVVLAGRLVVEEGRLTTLDLDAIRRHARTELDALLTRAGLP